MDLVEIELEIVVDAEDIALDPRNGTAALAIYAMPFVFVFERVRTESANVILLFDGNGRIDGRHHLYASEDKEYAHLGLEGVEDAETAQGSTLATFGNDRGNGTELGGGAAVVGVGEGEIYIFHCFLIMPRSKTARNGGYYCYYMATMFWMARSAYWQVTMKVTALPSFPHRGGISSLRMVMMRVAG